jgi:putative DeoR family transcriptional regulator (stage III sporulation protein D)
METHQGGDHMADALDKRACELAVYLIETGATVRAAGKKYGISKSTVHKNLVVSLKKIDYDLYKKSCSVMQKNKSERHLRGGMATKLKYMNYKNRKETI